MHEAVKAGRESTVLSWPEISDADRRLEGADPRETIAWAVETYGEGLALGLVRRGRGDGASGHDLQDNR
jgi:hypothetical protein